MANKSHFLFNNAVEGTVPFKQKPRYGGTSEEDEAIEVIDHSPKREDFIRSREQFFSQRAARIANRNEALQVPSHVEYIQIIFHNVFDSSVFENKYRQNFGLSPIRYTGFNTIGVFAIVDDGLFASFLEEIETFINTADHSGVVTYNSDIKFIKEFSFYSTDKIIHYRDFKPHIIIDLVESVEIYQNVIRPVEDRLRIFLAERGIPFVEDRTTGKLELLNVAEDIVKEIADNFDIIQSINSYAAGVIRPNAFNMPDRSFGFAVTNANSDLPIIGIIDTGISNQTPLAPLIVNEGNEFDLTGTSPIRDSANHGTSVALLAAMGKKLYPNHVGEFDADAKLLSIKVLASSGGFLAESKVINAIREAHFKYGIQIFTLTIGYTDAKNYNEVISEYAYALDVLTHELNILIFIAAGNNNRLSHFDGQREIIVSYPFHFEEEATNILSPAESFNNVTVGAVAGNMENNDADCISPDGFHPAIYTRKFHINWKHDSINWTRINKKLYKPDVCNYGGDYDINLNPERAGLKVLSTRPGLFFDREVGTSYPTPLTANLAARIINKYPSLKENMQTVKALIVNSARVNSVDGSFDELENLFVTHLLGNGIPNDEECLHSDENRITLILEDSITPEQIKSYPLIIPEYLLQVNRQNALLQVHATLCFKFEPIKNNQLAYCPIHLAFGVFRNKPLQPTDALGNPTFDGLNGNSMDNIKFKDSWSQDYYYKPKMLSNCQKQRFTISKKVLQEENCRLKVAVNAKFHKLLNAVQVEKYNRECNFSLVITVRENPIKNANTNRLYDDLSAVNTLTALPTIDLGLTAEATA